VLKRGEVYWIELDTARGSEASAVRPGVIVSSNPNNKQMPTVTICPFTSSVKRLYPFEVFVEASEAGLNKDSKIQAQQIRTVDFERLLEKIGTLNDDTLELVDEALKIHLSLT
jgi:mRNA interferase MazF